MAPRYRITSDSLDVSREYIDIDADLGNSEEDSSSNSSGDANAPVHSRDRVPNLNQPRQTVATGSTHEIHDLKEGLRRAQLENLSLKDELRALKLQYAELEQKYKVIKKAAKGSKATEKDSSKSKLSDTDEVVGLYARRFGVMNELYVTHNAFLQPRPVGVRADNSTRWQTEESALEGLIAELYEELPTRLHSKLANTSHFRDRFQSALNSNRRAIIFQLRTQTAGRIFKQDQAHYLAKSDRSTVFRAMIIEPGRQRFSKFAPILFPGRGRTTKKIFRNPGLPLMLRSILFGPSSLSASRQPSTSTVSHLWGVKRVTPGAIAFVAVLAIFLHSVDEKFQPSGQKSQIPYLKLFSTYKETIVTKLNEEDKYFEDLIMWYNSEVFNWFDANNGGDGSGSDSSGIDDILNIGNLTIDDIQIREQDDGEAWDCERIQFGAPQADGENPALEQDFFAPRSPSPPTAGPSNPQPQPEQGASANPVNNSGHDLATSTREPEQPAHDDEPEPTPAAKARHSTRKNTGKSRK